MIWQTFPKQIIKFGSLNKKDTTICKNYLQCLHTSLSTPRVLPFFYNFSLTFHKPWSKIMKALCHDIIFRKDGIALEFSLE